MEIDFVT